MLRRRPPPELGSSFVRDDDDPQHKRHASGKKAKRAELRVLSVTLSAALVSALKPSSDVRSQAYSEYLTSQVQNLTIGWHIFRTVTEGAFLATYGIAFNTFVVQLFWSLSVGSVLLYLLRRATWLRWREGICVWTNITYGIVTVLKIFHLVDRLPNENHYMFKHCFLTMADAALSQTPVHKQYIVQFSEAIIRVVVWRRYNVLADSPTWAVIAVSLAWQVWLVTFSAMLQARHVSAFRRRRALASPPASNPPSARPSLSAAVASRPASCEVEPAASSSAGPSTPKAAAAPVSVAAVSLRVPLRPKSPRSSTGAAGGPAAGAGREGGATATLSAVDVLRASSVSTAATSTASTASQKRFMRALRSVTRGPSSYVLLSHQRRQAGGPQCATAQFYIPAANPDMLSGSWRERLAAAVAEGAPGWQVAGVCARKGSLIVHLDLVYVPTGKGAAAAGAAAEDGGAAGAGEGCFPGVTYSEQPFDVAAGSRPAEQLNEFMDGMGAESLLALLGLPPDLPAGSMQPISLQMGDKIKELSPAAVTVQDPVHDNAAKATATVEPAAEVAPAPRSPPTAFVTAAAVNAAPAATDATDVKPTATAAANAATDVKPTATAAAGGNAASCAPSEAWHRLVALPLATALRPPAELRGREYASFLSERVGSLHLSYSSFICLAAVLLVVVRGARGINPLTLALFTSAELLTVASHAVLGGCASAAWRAARCGVVYVGLALRTAQMAACTCGFLPHLLRDSDCVSGRWIQKVVLITTLQALCMQPPVRTFFLIRSPSLLLSIYVHVFVCRTNATLWTAVALHLGWEGLLFLISANFQYRHLEAFRRRTSVKRSPSRGSCQEFELGREEEEEEVRKQRRQLDASCGEPACGESACGEPAAAAASADDAAAADAVAPAQHGAPASAANPTPPAAAAAAPPSGFLPAAASGDPYDVSLSAPLVAIAPRRAARLQLHFSCAPAVVEELQVVLRHINPAAMSSGVHAAHAVRDITRALGAPAGAAAAPPLAPAPFSAELTLVASPADMPGLVHVELWRGRRRVASRPVLLAAVPTDSPPPAAVAAANVAMMGAECAGECGDACGGGGGDGSWLDDVAAYVGGLREQGHVAAADQFIEELGSWMAQAAALERGLTASSASAAAVGPGAPRVANVLYFHGYGSEFMYLKPRRLSGAGGGDHGGGAAAAAAASAASASDPLRDTLRQLLVVQGSMLLAVAVEAGCVALSSHLAAVMAGELGSPLEALLGSARTPVTQLPLLHAAVKSGKPRMVDLVVDWCTRCGMKGIWAAEAAILAGGLDSRGSSAAGDMTASSLGSAGLSSAAGRGIVAAAAEARRRSLRSLLSAPERSSASALRSLELRPSREESPRHRHSGGGGSAEGPLSSGLAISPRSQAAAAAAQFQFQAAPFITGEGMDRMVAAADAVVDADVEGFLDSLADGDSVILKDMSEESPFRIIDFRASSRTAGVAALAAAAEAAAATEAGAGAGASGGTPCGSVGEGVGAACSGPAASLDGSLLVDSGVVVLTPLHLALALGDEGRLASHILRTYPEALQVWRNGHLSSPGGSVGGGTGPLDAGPSSSNPSFIDVALIGDASGVSSDSCCAGIAIGCSGSSGLGAVGLSPAAAAAAFSSLPGLVGRVKAGGRGTGAGGSMAREDSVEAGSLQSVSLSEVAFFEGIRWVDEDMSCRRPGFKVTRM